MRRRGGMGIGPNPTGRPASRPGCGRWPGAWPGTLRNGCDSARSIPSTTKEVGWPDLAAEGAGPAVVLLRVGRQDQVCTSTMWLGGTAGNGDSGEVDADVPEVPLVLLVPGLEGIDAGPQGCERLACAPWRASRANVAARS